MKSSNIFVFVGQGKIFAAKFSLSRSLEFSTKQVASCSPFKGGWLVWMLFFFIFSLSNSNLWGQEISLDNKLHLFNIGKQALNDTIEEHSSVDLPFIVGLHHNPIADKDNHPYFGENEWGNGALVFDGKIYEAQSLKYDIETDHLIYYMLSPSSYTMICVALERNFISEFNLFNKTFRCFYNLKTENGKHLDDGYYEVVYDGDLKFVIRWEKERTVSESYNHLRYGNPSIRMFLLDGATAVPIKRMATLVKFLDGEKKERLKVLIKEKHLKINRGNYQAASDVLQYYENLQLP